ncbi:MAG: isoamylase early set domain-containing protein [Verrucomicrobiota bacterium]
MSSPINSQQKSPGSALHRYSAKRVSKPVNFVCYAPGAKQVAVIGDFNGWEPSTHPMKRQPDGAWMVQVQLTHGHHQYLFCVDGQPQLDPRAQGVARTAEGERVSLLAIS